MKILLSLEMINIFNKKKFLNNIEMDYYQINKIVIRNEDNYDFEIEYLNNTELKFIMNGYDDVSLDLTFEKKDIKKLIKILNYWLENNRLIDLDLIN